MHLQVVHEDGQVVISVDEAQPEEVLDEILMLDGTILDMDSLYTGPFGDGCDHRSVPGVDPVLVDG